MYRACVCALITVCFNFIGLNSVLAAQTYDVSYVWSRNLNAVQDYRNQIAKVLGPSVTKALKVVAIDDLYGLIYHRRGDSEGAIKVAKVHTRLLSAHGLESASPIRSQNWNSVDKLNRSQKSKSTSVREPIRKYRSKIVDLEAAVEAYIQKLRRTGKIAADERTGWSVYDFTTGEKLVTINEDMRFQAASLVKPFIAAAFFYKVNQGALRYGPKSRRHMRRMIQYSSNSSSNWVIRQVGGPEAVQMILKNNYPGIYKETHLVEYIPSNGRTYRNRASVHDYSRFLYAIWKEEIPGAQEIKRLMALPGSDRIYTGVPEVPKGTRVYNKTGSTARMCGDMGILSVKGRDGKRYPYILIGIIEKQQRAESYTAWIRSRSKVIRNVSAIVYKGIIAHHDDS
jgi:beta-lactamase class A